MPSRAIPRNDGTDGIVRRPPHRSTEKGETKAKFCAHTPRSNVQSEQQPTCSERPPKARHSRARHQRSQQPQQERQQQRTPQLKIGSRLECRHRNATHDPAGGHTCITACNSKRPRNQPRCTAHRSYHQWNFALKFKTNFTISSDHPTCQSTCHGYDHKFQSNFIITPDHSTCQEYDPHPITSCPRYMIAQLTNLEQLLQSQITTPSSRKFRRS